MTNGNTLALTVQPEPSEAEIAIMEKRTRFASDLDPRQRQQLAIAAIAYGLDPLFGELTIYEGKPMVTIAGLRRIAHASGTLDAIRITPLTPQERELHGFTDKYAYKAELWKIGAAHPFVAYGHADVANVFAKQLQRWMAEIAQKRAEARVIRMAYSVSMMSLEEAYENSEYTPIGNGKLGAHNVEIITTQPTASADGEGNKPAPTGSIIVSGQLPAANREAGEAMALWQAWFALDEQGQRVTLSQDIISHYTGGQKWSALSIPAKQEARTQALHRLNVMLAIMHRPVVSKFDEVEAADLTPLYGQLHDLPAIVDASEAATQPASDELDFSGIAADGSPANPETGELPPTDETLEAAMLVEGEETTEDIAKALGFK